MIGSCHPVFLRTPLVGAPCGRPSGGKDDDQLPVVRLYEGQQQAINDVAFRPAGVDRTHTLLRVGFFFPLCWDEGPNLFPLSL